MSEIQSIAGPDGKPIKAEEMDFDVSAEPWAIIKVKDGTTLRLRMNVLKVIRGDAYDPLTGDPLYVVQSNNTMRIEAPKKLKKFGR